MSKARKYCAAIAEPFFPAAWERYTALPLAQRQVLWVLSICYYPLSLGRLRKMVERLYGKDSQPRGEVTAALREQLLQRGVIQLQEGLLQCSPELVELITREVVATRGFARMLLACNDELRNNSEYAPPADTHYYREVRNHLYARRERELLGLLRSRTGGELRSGVSGVEPLLQICTTPFDLEWFQQLSTSLQFHTLAPLLNEAARYLEAANPVWELALQQFAQSEDPAIRFWLGEQWLFRGRPAQAEALLPNDSSSTMLAQLGAIRFLQGRDRDAVNAFTNAQALLRRRGRRGGGYVPGLAGVFFVLALLRGADPLALTQASEQVERALEQACDDYFEPVLRTLRDTIEILSGRMEFADSVWLRREPLVVEPYLDLIRALALHWLEQDLAARQVARLPDYCEAAKQGGWFWFAEQCVHLFSTIESGWRKSVEPPSDELPFVPITSLTTTQESWEQALYALQQVAESGGGQSDLRMSWRLIPEQGLGYTLVAREQRLGKNGSWGRGRPVALERLHEEDETLTYLSEQDQEICRAIQVELKPGLYGRIAKKIYTINPESALLAAIGHPLLFREDDLERPVELVAGEPVLEIQQQQQRLLLQLQPTPPPTGQQLRLLEEGPRRLRVVRFSNTHRRVAEILGSNGLSVPATAREQVLTSIATIAPLLTIHSDIGIGEHHSAEEVVSAAKPHLYLKPLGEGLAMECYVQPFGEYGPTLRPGEGRSSLFCEVDGKSLHTERDLEAERQIAARILEACPQLNPDEEWNWIISDPEQALDTLMALQQLGDAITLDWPQGRRIRLTNPIGVGRLRIAIHQQQEWLGLDGELQIDEQRAISLKDLFALMDESNGRYLRLGEEEFLTLTRDLRRRIDGLRDLADGGGIHPLTAPLLEELTNGMEVTATPAWQQQLTRLEQVREFRPELPSTLCAELRDYQLTGFHWLARLAHWGAGACLADDMGLGKTLQALALILSRAEQGATLVLAPTSVCNNWLEEAARFAPTLNLIRFGGSNRSAQLAALGPYDLVVCSYGLMQAESERLREIPWTTLVADEAQALKNTLTKRSQAAMSLTAGFRLITTGTPIENHLGELWTLFRLINPGLLGSLERFNRRYAVPMEKHNDPAVIQRLRQLIRPFILRRLKSDVLTELPERTEITLHVELSEAEQTFYQAQRMLALDRIRNSDQSGGQRHIQLLAEITRLRQACCNPRLVLPESDLPSAKLQLFAEIVEELRANRHKALVFSQFVGHLRLLREYLDRKQIDYRYLDGSTPSKQRAEEVSAFQRGKGDLFLISLRAGGSGLNLTAADYVIHMDPWWNPAVEDQASDRAHRIGQKRPVTVYRLVAKETIEEKIVRLHAHKRDLADNLLEGSDLSGRMSVEEMIELLQGEVGG